MGRREGREAREGRREMEREYTEITGVGRVADGKSYSHQGPTTVPREGPGSQLAGSWGAVPPVTAL